MAPARRIAVLLILVLGAAALPAWTLTPAGAAPDDPAFSRLDGFAPRGEEVRVRPDDYVATRVDFASLRAGLPGPDGSRVLSVPDPRGRSVAFRVVPTQRMESELAAAHPEISTFSGRAVGDPRTTIALDLTPMGFHASVRGSGPRGAWFVDPAYNERGTDEHLSYYARSLEGPERRRVEGEIRNLRDTVDARVAAQSTEPDAPVSRKVYRLALTSDPSYADYFGTENVLAEKVTLMNRVNQVYNDDLAIDLRLVNETPALNLDTEAKATGPDGPCGAAPCFRVADEGDPTDPDDDLPGDLDFCSGLTLGQNRTVLGQLVGASDYDIGHIALGKNGGGIAYLGVVGGDYKGGGCTGLPQPVGDFFAIDYVAHEMGHQFDGPHTFNGVNGACGGNISEASVEPGSGSSVMAYAGICGQDDLQPHTDPYFSFQTVDAVTDYTESTDYSVVEVQTASLRGFDTDGESIEIGFGDADPVTVTRGDDYTSAGIEAAVEEVTGRNVSIAEWGFDEFGASPVPEQPDDGGFQVIFNELPTVNGADASDVDLGSLTVSGASRGVSGFVGETAQGGDDLSEGSSSEATANNNPAVTAPEDRTIPVRTPFELTGSATDSDGDELVYLWEQTDFGNGTALADNNKVTGSLFRVFGTAAEVSDEDTLKSPSPGINVADGNPTRVFPDLAQVLAGNTNAETGRCPEPTTPTDEPLPPGLRDCYSEFLPVPGYVGTLGSVLPQMHFRLTARDLFPNGGGLSSADVTLDVDPAAGPFSVTSQGGGRTLDGGSVVPVRWDVNNTEALASHVRITASTDGGDTFGRVLARRTPNDGSQRVTLPNVDAEDVRIKVAAVDNYFFDVNDASFSLTETSPPDTVITAGPREDAIVLERRVRFRYDSDDEGATFECRVNGDRVPCGTRAKRLRLPGGTHTFSVAAVDASGIADPTPASRTFTIPVDDGRLVRKGAWQRVRDTRTFGNDYSRSRDRGARLVTPVRGLTRLALVVSTRRNAGAVRVFLGEDRLRRISLKGRNRTQQVIDVARFDERQRSKLRIVVARNKQVRIEGVAIVRGS